MSSPLSTLRKYQFAFFVFFGVVCMLVFVIGDPLDTWLRSRSGGGRRAENKVVVSWRGGELRESELDNTRIVRNVIGEFIRTLLEETQKKNGAPRVRPLSLSPREEDIVYTRLLAQRAKDMGMVVSDEMALIYLEQLTATLIPRAGIGSIFQETVGDRITEQQLLAEIKSELLAQNYLSLTYPDLTGGQLPVQAWEYHRRLHRRVKAEVAPVNAADFTSKVTKEPSDAEIETLFAAAKDRYPEPALPDPGFKRHRKAAFEFVRADRKKFEDEEAAKLKPQITDQEIQAYYDKNKDEFRIPEAPPEQPKPNVTPPATPEGAKPAGDKPAAEKGSPPAGTPASEKSPEKSPPESGKAEDKKSEDKKSEDKSEPQKAADQPTAEKPTEKPAADKSDANKPDEKKADEKKNEPAADPTKSTDAPPAGACGDDSPTAKSEQKSADPVAAPTQEKPAEPATPAAPTAEKKADAPAADKKSTQEKAETATEEPKANPAAAPPATATPEKPSTAVPGSPLAPLRPEPKYKPLDDTLKAEIREKLAKQQAAQAAQQRIDKGFDEVRKGIEKYARDKRSAELTNKPVPQPIDLAKIAESHGMTSGNIAISDPKKIQETELGKTRGFDFSSMNFQAIPFHILAYRDGIPLWKPDTIRGGGIDGSPEAEFLFWKTNEEEPFVPELKDVRSEVVQAWKLREALALAQAEATSLADKAKQSGKTLKETFADNKDWKIAETNLFSWMTRGFLPANMGGAPTLSAVENVEFAGQEFMRSVFQLHTNEVGTAVNQPRSVVYIVRIETESPSDDDLRAQFLQTGSTIELQQIANVDRFDVRQSWFEALRREMDVKWERTPQG